MELKIFLHEMIHNNLVLRINNRVIKENETVNFKETLYGIEYFWNNELNKLYSLFLINDTDQTYHYAVVNIIGCFVNSGRVVISYVPIFNRNCSYTVHVLEQNIPYVTKGCIKWKFIYSCRFNVTFTNENVSKLKEIVEKENHRPKYNTVGCECSS